MARDIARLGTGCFWRDGKNRTRDADGELTWVQGCWVVEWAWYFGGCRRRETVDCCWAGLERVKNEDTSAPYVDEKIAGEYNCSCASDSARANSPWIKTWKRQVSSAGCWKLWRSLHRDGSKEERKTLPALPVLGSGTRSMTCCTKQWICKCGWRGLRTLCWRGTVRKIIICYLGWPHHLHKQPARSITLDDWLASARRWAACIMAMV